MSFASACVPTSDLSSYSNAASEETADHQGDRAAPANDPPTPRRPEVEPLEPGRKTPRSDESILGSNAPVDPGMPGASKRSGIASDIAAADAGRRLDAGPFLPPVDAASTRAIACGPGETPGANGRCYFPVAALLAWEAARTNCQQRAVAWDLASIRSASDSTFVASLLDQETWVGGSDGDAEETWAWVADGFQFWQGEGLQGQPLNGAFVNWFDDEPNGSSTSDCLRLLGDSRWADLECTELRPSVCEGPPI